MSYRHGYARVSISAQDTQLHLDALHATGVDRTYVDRVSGVATHRSEFDNDARPGDTQDARETRSVCT